MPAENIYRIKEGDTLSDLFGQNWQEVAAFNGIDDPTKLQVGQEINLNLYDYSIVPQGQESQEQQLSGEDEFKSGAADWATSFFREVGADARDVYEDLSASSIGDDVFSSFTKSPDSSFPMPGEAIEELTQAPIVTPEETIEPIVERYAENLKEYEGNYNNSSFAHKPNSTSGITIAQGLDASQTTRAEMASLGVPERVLIDLDNVDAFTKGISAIRPKNPVKMTRDEFDIVSANIAEKARGDAIEFKRDYPKLNNKGISILMSLKHWGGGWNSNSETKLTRYSDNIDTGTAVTTGVLVSPIKEALSNPDVTNEDLIAALDTTRKSYVPWGAGVDTFRYKTLSKYIKRLEE